MTLAETSGTLLDAHDALVLDLDGVVYVGQDAVPDAVPALNQAAAAGLPLRFVTNNASRPPAEVARHLTSLGLSVGADQVVTSSQAAATLVLESAGPGAKVLAVGGPGVAQALREAGLVPVHSADDDPVAVVQGYGVHVGWRQLAEVAFAVRGGSLWVATNTDATLPTARGPAPGNGALVAAVATATGATPRVAGKPEPTLFAVAAEGARAPLGVGDRLDTDVAAARRASMSALLVLTGVTSWRQLLSASPAQRPHYVARSLGGLHERHQAPVADDTGGWRCGTALASVRDGTLRLEQRGEEVLDAVRVLAAAAWDAADHRRQWELDPETGVEVDAAVGVGR